MVAFRKMHGLGNDFVVIDNRDHKYALNESQIRLMADRHLGIGCDQFIILEKAPTNEADLFMRIHNPDASEAGACGNATRCVASLLIQETGKQQVVIETLRGLLHCANEGNGLYSVDMGEAILDWQDIPLSSHMDIKSIEMNIEGLGSAVAVGMGNPHCVFFVEDANAIDLENLGPIAEHHPSFPERTNVEFISRNADGSLRMRVWERSAGITMACGSGACAAAVAAVLTNYVDTRKMDIQLDGGILSMNYLENGHVIMTGPVATSFTGNFPMEGA